MNKIESFVRRPLPRAAAMAGLALVLVPAALFCGVERPRAETTETQESGARPLLAAVRGISPVACELAAQSLGNGWAMAGGDAEDAPSLARRDESTERTLAWLGAQSASADDVAALRDGLGDPDACVRRVSARMLGRRRVEGGVDVLLTALRSGEPLRRDAAVLGLGYAGDPRTVAPLTALLGDGDAEVRGGAVWALGHTRSREASASVARLTGDREPRVRRAVARALGRLEDASSVPALTRLLASDPDPGVRRAAAWALGRFD
jgi:HEAT repeat protein